MYEYSPLHILVFMDSINSSAYYIHFILLLFFTENVLQFWERTYCKYDKYSEYLNES